MLKRKLEAPAAPEILTAISLPVVEQESTVVVISDTDPEHLAEVAADTHSEAVTEPSEPEHADADDVVAVSKPRTGALPLVAFKPVEKDMADDDEVPYAPPMSKSIVFDADYDDDEFGIQQNRSVVPKAMTDDEWDDLIEDQLKAKAMAYDSAKKAEKAIKEKAEQEEAKRAKGARKRKFLRRLGNSMIAASFLALIYAVIVPYVPWL